MKKAKLIKRLFTNEEIIAIDNRNRELEKENKKLRDYVDNLDSENDNQAIEIEELKKENKELKAKINKVIELFNEWDSSDLYDYIDDLDYEED